MTDVFWLASQPITNPHVTDQESNLILARHKMIGGAARIEIASLLSKSSKESGVAQLRRFNWNRLEPNPLSGSLLDWYAWMAEVHCT